MAVYFKKKGINYKIILYLNKQYTLNIYYIRKRT